MNQKSLSKKLTKLTDKNIVSYQKHLVEELKLSPATVKRRLSSIRKFSDWAFQQGYLEKNPFLKETEIPGKFIPQKLTPKANVFQKAYQTYSQFSVTKYFHYAILIIFCAAIGFGAYDQFFKKTPTPLAYPESLTAPNRFLSFQGRLTDSSDNPISGYTDITFKLWKTSSGGTEGTCTGDTGEDCLWTSGTCSVNSDQDGIFSLLLGTTSGPEYTCSAAIEIPADVFTENTDIWLAITVDDDGEMDPRMQVATVGYALNAETLQGYPPGTEASMIPYIDSTGKVVLAAASPTIQATSGTFALEGQTGITIQVADGQDGNITLSPKGTGTVNLTSEATTGNLLNNQGGANFGTEGGKEDNNLYYGYVGLDTTNFNLLKLEAGETPSAKFTVDASGNASAAGILKALTTGSYLTGDITVSGGDITGANSVVLDIGEASADYITSSVGLAVGGAQTYYINTGTSNLNALALAGDLTIDTNDFFVDASENKIGIGTTTLTERLTLAGNATISGTLALAPNVQFDAGTCDAAAAGKMYFDGDENKYYFCNGTNWTEMGSGSGGGDSWWTEALGLLYPVNETLDLAVGGTSTDSANVKLGASSDSNSFIAGGNVGIGTTDPGTKLTIAGDSSSSLKAGHLSTDNILLSSLEGGMYFGGVGVKENQWGLSNYGDTWTAKDSSRDWRRVAMSSDGKIQTAVAEGYQIYVSTDYGDTWTAKDSSRDWEGVAMSSDGKIQTATVIGGQIYVSTDYGDTWTAKDSNRDWYGVAMSSDGKIQTAGDGTPGQIYVSIDYGNTWTAKDSSRDWYDIAMSSDGKIQTATVCGGQVYVSTDYGNTWTAKDSSRGWRYVAMSSDGKIQTAGDGTPGQIYVSTDYGDTWMAKDSSRKWRGVAMSSDGKIQTAGVGDSQIYVSTDYGDTWTAKDPSRSWRGVAMSSDGKIQTAVAPSSQIYVSYTDSFIYGGNIGIGTTDPSAKLDISGTNTGKPLVSLNETGTNDILVASVSGNLKTSIDNNGYLNLYANYINPTTYERGKLGYESGSNDFDFDFNADDEAKFSQEDLAYTTTLSPSATSGDITLTLGSGNWNTNSKVKQGARVVGNSGIATIMEDPTASSTINAYVNTSFTNTNPIASGDWYLYATKFNSLEQLVLNNFTSKKDFATTGKGVVLAASATQIDTNKILVVYPDCNQDSGTCQGIAVVASVSGETINYGSETVFLSSGWTEDEIYDYYISLSATKLDTDKALIAYSAPTTYYGKALVASVSGTTISLGNESTFFEGSIYHYLSLVPIATNKVLIAHPDSDSGSGHALVVSVNGTTINYGSSVTFCSYCDDGFSAAQIDTDKALIAYDDDYYDEAYAVVASVSGDTISLGSAEAFNSSYGIYGVSVAQLDTDKALIAYDDSEDWEGNAIVASVSGTTISFGSEATFNLYDVWYMHTTKLDTDKVLIAYVDGDSYYGNAIVASVSGTTISYGSPEVFEPNEDAPVFDAVAIDTNKAVLLSADDYCYGIGKTYVASVSGTTISLGSANTLNQNADVEYISAVKIATDKILLAYSDPGDSNQGEAVVASISGDNISYGAGTTFAATAYDISVAKLDTDKALIVYTDDSDCGTAVVASVSGTTISYGSAEAFSGYGYEASVCQLDTDKALIAYDYDGDGVAVVASVSGTTISYGSDEYFNYSNPYYISVAKLDTDKAIIAYSDSGDGIAVVASVSGTTISYGSEEYFSYYYPYYISIANLDTDKALIAYSEYYNNYYGYAIGVSVSGSTITLGDAANFNAVGDIQGLSTAKLDTDKALITYINSDYDGIALTASASGLTITFGDENTFSSNPVSTLFSTDLDTDKAFTAFGRFVSTQYYGTASVMESDGNTVGNSFYSDDEYYVTTTSDDNQLLVTSWSNFDPPVVSQTLNNQTVNYSISFDDRTTWKIYDTTEGDSGWRPIARDNSGTWEYNSNTTAGATDITWTSASTNTQFGALDQAFQVTANQLTGYEFNNITTSQWIESGGFSAGSTQTIDFAYGLKTTSKVITPKVSQNSFSNVNDSKGVLTLASEENGSGLAKALKLSVGSIDALFINNSGNIGIGTTSPTSKLDVAGTVDLRGADGQIGLNVNADGEVGIGTNTQTDKLDVAGTVSLRGAAGQTGLYVSEDGYVGIGTTSPGYELDVSGNGYFSTAVGIGTSPDYYTGVNVIKYGYGSASAYGERNVVGVYGYGYGNPKAFGNYNQVMATAYSGSGTPPVAYGSYNYIVTANNAYVENGFANFSSLRSYTGDTVYGNYIQDDSGYSGGGTQYGLYVDLDDTDTTNYSLYIEDGSGSSYFGSDVSIGGGLTGSEDALSVNTGAGFSGNLLKLAVNSSQKLAIDSTGMLTTASGVFTSTVTDAADAIGFKLITPAYTTAGAKLLSVWNNTDEKMSLDKDGVLALYNSESMIYNSSGDITIDAASGNVSFASNNLINIDDLTMGGTASISGTPNLTLIPTTNLAKIYTLNGGDLAFFTSVGGDTGVAERLRLTNSGDVGIGTTTPSYKLDVAGTAGFNSGGVTIDTDSFVNAARFVDTANSDYYIDPAHAGTSGTFYGNVGIGTVTPSAKLQVNGDVFINANTSTDDVVKTTTTDFTISGYATSNVTTTSNQISIDLDSGAGAAVSAGPTAANNVYVYAHSFQRPDGKFVTPGGTSSTSTNIYDPSTNTFSSGPTTTAATWSGQNSFQRPDGKFILLIGNSTTTNIYDPATNTFSAGPALTAAIHDGSHSFQRPDGKTVVIISSTSTTTNIYDPSTNTFSAGPALSGNAHQGSHSFQRPDGKYITIHGNSTTGTSIYDPATNTFSAGPALSGNVGAGGQSFQRPDGKYITIHGNSLSTTSLYDPSTNTFSAGPALTTTAGWGSHSLQYPDGKFLVIVSGTTTNIYDPSTNSFSVGPSLTGSEFYGSHSFQRPDGKYITFLANDTTTTNIIDLGWQTSGYWESEDLNITTLSNSSSLSWKAANEDSTNPSRLDQKNIIFQVKTASTQGGLTSATYQTINNSGDNIPITSGDTWAKVKINFNVPIPANPTGANYSIKQTNVWLGESSTFYQRQFPVPAVFEFSIENPIASKGGSGALSNSWLYNSSGLGDNSSNHPTLENLETDNDNALKITFYKNLNDNTTNDGIQIYSSTSSLTANAGSGAHTLKRPDGKFLIILGDTSTTTNIYDPATSTFTAGPDLTANVGVGAHSFQRPDGKFVTILGGTTTTSNIYDPLINTFSAGPDLTATVKLGAHSFQRPDGKFVTILGNSTITNIYDPATNSFTAGPDLTTTAGYGSYSFPTPDGMFITVSGAGGTSSSRYDPATNVFLTGPTTGYYVYPGAQAWQQANGLFVTVSYHTSQTWSSFFCYDYDSNYNAFINRGYLTTYARYGSHSLQMPNGKFFVILGNTTTTTNIYDPSTTITYQQAGPALTAGVEEGGHSFQRPDGKFVTILGNQTTNVDIIDVGWALTGTYISEPINSSSLSTDTILNWKTANSKDKVTAKVRTADSATALGLASWTDVPYNGADVNSSGNSWIQVRFDLEGSLSDSPIAGALKNVWVSDSGVVNYYREPSSPTLTSYSLANRTDGSVLAISSNNSTIFRFTSEGSAFTGLDGAWYSGGADIAEYYSSSQELGAGEIVVVDENQTQAMVRSSKPYQATLAGAVSTTPGFVAGAYTEGGYPIALSGRVPVLVSDVNGPIKTGNPITSSDIPGVGMKATQFGPIVGRALEDLEGTTGSIMTFIDVSLYDPHLLLASTGDLVIKKEASQSGSPNDEATSSALLAKYNLKDSLGEIIQRIGAFSEAAIANLRAGRIETEELISPLIKGKEIETERLSLSELTPLADQDLVINLQPTLTSDQEASESSSSSFGKLIVKGKEGKEVVSIDAEGNASFSGELSAENLQINNDATIAGTLYADEIITRHGKFGDLLVNEIVKTETPIESMDEFFINEATDSAILSEEEINNLINEILASVPETTSQAELSENISIPNDLLVSNSLNIGGTLSLADNAINTFSGPLYLQSLGLGGIDILAGKIVIDEHGNATFEGDLTIKGKLAAKSINPLPENDLVINLAQIPITNESETDLPNEATQSAFGKLLIKGFEGQTVASIDASGSAYFASLGLEADYSATQSGTIIAAYDNWLENNEYSPAIKTNATTGLAILPAYEQEIMIYNPKITDQSLIYITPVTDTENKVIYVKAKKAEKPAFFNENNELIPEEKGWFKVAIDASINQEIKFNWWIIN